MTYAKVCQLKPAAFRRYCGLKRETFDQVMDSLRPYLPKTGQRGGQPGFSAEDQFLIALEYWREYRTQFHIAQSWGTSEATVCRTVRRVEDKLALCGYSRLPGKKSLKDDDSGYELIAIDATESAIERPKKKQRQFYSGKKKKHTFSVQVMIDLVSLQVICTCFGKGRENDFAIFKRSEIDVSDQSELLADKGYQGIAKLIEKSFTPVKKPRNGELTQTQRQYNRELAKIRIKIEHVFAKLKKFRILSERYRNRRKRFGLRFNLIASLYNLELNH